jgi:hypothetical protein
MSDSGISWGSGLTPDELASRLKAHPFADVREPLMHKITLTVLRHAMPRTPVRTGTLRRSETTRVEAGGLRGYVGTNVVYAPFVHARAPFFGDAMADSRSEIQKILQDAGDGYFKDLL